MFGEHKYEGGFKDGYKHGQGTMTYSNGENYVGEFKDGKKWNGKGTHINLIGGRKYVGDHKDGKRWKGTMYDKEGYPSEKWVNGVEHY